MAGQPEAELEERTVERADGTGRLLAGRYRVVSQLGRGGMGIVWRAVDEVLGREVAVKELRTFTDAAVSELAALRLRMQREARAAARIRHPGVVAVHDVAEVDGRPLIVMELVDGRSLDNVLGERGTLDPREAAAIGAQVMDALAAAHRVGVLHRDVKPGNILLEASGRVVLTDFGIARMEDPGDGSATNLTRSGELVGSLDYLAPERAQGNDPGPASDIWALGATLYAAVEGTSPFRRTSTWSTLTAIVAEPVPDCHQAGALGPVLHQLMAKSPEERPDAETARGLLEAVASSERGTTERMTTGLRQYGAAAAGVPEAGDGEAAESGVPAVPPGPGPAGRSSPVLGAGEPASSTLGPAEQAPTATGAEQQAPPGFGAPEALASRTPAPGAPDDGHPVAPTTFSTPAAPARPRRRRRALLVAAAVTAVLAAVGGGTAALLHGGDDSKAGARPTASKDTRTGTPSTGTGGSDRDISTLPTPTDKATVTSPTPTLPGGAGSGTTPSPDTPACESTGDGKYNCKVWRTAKSYDASGTEVGVLNSGINYFYCQQDLGRRETAGEWTNVWWAKTDDDRGNTDVYVSDVYIEGGDNDAPVPGLPLC